MDLVAAATSPGGAVLDALRTGAGGLTGAEVTARAPAELTGSPLGHLRRATLKVAHQGVDGLRMGRIAIIAAVVLSGLAMGAAAADRPAYVAARCNALAIRPATVVPCGQNAQELLALHWRRWGRPRATGTGSLYTNTCVPDCPSGQGRIDRVRVTLDRLRTCAGGRLEYTRLTYTPVIAGSVAAGRAALPCR